MTAPFPSPETLDEAVTEHLELVSEVKKLCAKVDKLTGDLLAVRTSLTQAQLDVLRALDAATVASANGELVLREVKGLRADVNRAMNTNGAAHG